MKYMKYLAIFVNVAVLVFLTFLCVTKRAGTEDLIITFVITLYCVVNLIVSCFARVEGPSWLGLYFKRKRLEEQKRIETLEKASCEKGEPPQNPDS